MTVKISHTAAVQSFFKEAAGFASDNGNPRLKSIILRVLQDSAKTIEDLDISEDEFWKSVDYLNRLGGRSEAGLLVAGLGIEPRAARTQHQPPHQRGLAQRHLCRQHGTQPMAHQRDRPASQRIDQRQAALRQALEGVGFDRCAVAITRHVPRHGAVASAGQPLDLGRKREVAAIGIVQHEHGGACAQGDVGG